MVLQYTLLSGGLNLCCNQPKHQVSLINGFVIHFLESVIPQLASCKISMFSLVSVAELV